MAFDPTFGLFGTVTRALKLPEYRISEKLGGKTGSVERAMQDMTSFRPPEKQRKDGGGTSGTGGTGGTSNYTNLYKPTSNKKTESAGDLARRLEKERKRQEAIQKKAEEEAKEEAKERQVYEKELQKQFPHDQKLLAGCLNILRFIAASLEEDPAFFPLRRKIINIITDNPHNEILNQQNVHFSVSPTIKPPYRIFFKVSWSSYQYIILFVIRNRDGKANLYMNLFQHEGNIDVPLEENEAVTEIIKFLMTV